MKFIVSIKNELCSILILSSKLQVSGRYGGIAPVEGVAKDRVSGLERGGDFPHTKLTNI